MMIIQYNLSDGDVAAFDQLKQATDSKDDQELLDNAMTMLQWGVGQVFQHRQVGSFDPERKTYRALLMQALKTAAAKVRAAERDVLRSVVSHCR